ncbi:MAG TPA: hypothetical protein VE467_10130, partial [Chryseolinea sp.]|nr:hypothetical protein [Chryseolinea sp.]
GFFFKKRTLILDLRFTIVDWFRHSTTVKRKTIVGKREAAYDKSTIANLQTQDATKTSRLKDSQRS